MRDRQLGFTLIELLITIVIIAILASIAYPSYMGSIRKARREEAKRTLVEAAQRLENFYAMNLTYSGAAPTASSIMNLTLSAEFNNYYSLAVATTASTFTVTGAPTGAQAADICGSLSINSLNVTSASANGCW